MLTLVFVALVLAAGYYVYICKRDGKSPLAFLDDDFPQASEDAPA